MSLFGLNLFEKLLDDGTDGRGHPSIDRLKDSVARDVEALLNTRRGLSEEALQAYSLSKQTLLSFGLKDFVSLSLAKEGDRAQICEDINLALRLHEPRLKDTVVSVSVADGATQRLHFSIQAILMAPETQEVVKFDAVLQPNNLRYQVSRGR